MCFGIAFTCCQILNVSAADKTTGKHMPQTRNLAAGAQGLRPKFKLCYLEAPKPFALKLRIYYATTKPRKTRTGRTRSPSRMRKDASPKMSFPSAIVFKTVGLCSQRSSASSCCWHWQFSCQGGWGQSDQHLQDQHSVTSPVGIVQHSSVASVMEESPASHTCTAVLEAEGGVGLQIVNAPEPEACP